MERQSRFDLALETIREAGTSALEQFNARQKLNIQSKGLQDLVSEADIDTERLIRSKLLTAFPEDAFLGEESGKTDLAPGQGLWVVDPIDGTLPFLSGLTNWCVSIGFIKDGIIQFGLVYAPARDELFCGGINIKPTLNGDPIAPHSGRSVQDGLTAVGYTPRTKYEDFLPVMECFLAKGGLFFRDGSGALNLCYVASGSLIGYLEPHINSWDCVAALAICYAVGLKSNDFFEHDGLQQGNHLLVGNDTIFSELTEIYHC